MPTWGAVGLGADNADVDADEPRSFYDETLGLPPKAPYLCAVKLVRKGETGPNSDEPGTPKLYIILEIAEEKGTVKAKYNGYPFFLHIPVTTKSAGRVNAILKALLGNTTLTDAKKTAVLKAFWDGKVVYDKDTENITKIGTWVLPDDMMLGVTTRKGSWQGEDKLDVDGVMSPADAPKGRPATDEDVEDDEDETDEDATEDDEEDPEVAERAEELDGLTLVKLKAVAKGLGAKLAEYKALEKGDLIEFILDLEFPADDESEPEEEDEEDEEDDGEPEADEFDEMDRAALKKYIKAEGLEIRVTTGKSDDDLRGEIRAAVADTDDEEPEDEEEPDEEEAPEEPAPKRGGRQAAARPAGRGRPAARRRGADKNEPPF